jgi:hypothetical protein
MLKVILLSYTIQPQKSYWKFNSYCLHKAFSISEMWLNGDWFAPLDLWYGRLCCQKKESRPDWLHIIMLFVPSLSIMFAHSPFSPLSSYHNIMQGNGKGRVIVNENGCCGMWPGPLVVARPLPEWSASTSFFWPFTYPNNARINMHGHITCLEIM